MNLKIQHFTICLCLILNPVIAADKWSRQIEATGPGSETYDWIPVAQPVDAKERTGRVITYQQNFPPNAAFGEQQKHHHAPAPQQIQPFGFPFHYQRFPQPQTQPLTSQPSHAPPQVHQQQPIQQQKINLQPQQPTSQSFFKFEMPYNREGNRNQENPQGVQTGYQIQHSSFGAPQALFHSPLFTQKQVFPPEFHPAQRPQQSLLQQQPKPIQQNFVEEPKQVFRESNPIPNQSNLAPTTTQPQAFPIQQPFEVQKPTTFQSQLPFHAPPQPAPAAPVNNQQDQEVQLLYVPYDTLYNQQKNENPAFEGTKYNVGNNVQQVNPYQINNFYTQEGFVPEDPNRYTTSTTLRPTTTTFKSPALFQNFFNQQFTTPKPKPKAHQPPLAMFLITSSLHPSHADVVSALKNAKTIAVLDAPTAQAPAVFVGPAGMQTPNGYAKFELPYLSQIAQNSNLRDISFFVAPLSYRTPAGFNKILLPEPHVGSIVVNRQKGNKNNEFRGSNQQQGTQVDTFNSIKYANQPSQPSQIETYNNIRGSNQPSPSLTQQSDLYNSIRGTSLSSSSPQRENFNNIRGSNQHPTLAPTRESYNTNLRGSNESPSIQPQRETYNTQSPSPSPQSEVYNSIRNSNQVPQNQNIFITPSQNEIPQVSTTTSRPISETTQRVRTTTPRQYFSEIVRDVPKLDRGRFPYEITSQRPATPNRGHKYSEISAQKNYYPELVQEVTSPKVYKQERVKPTYQPKRPESQYLENVRPYAQFKPIPNNIPAEDFYKVQPIKTSLPTTSTSTSTTAVAATTSTAPPRSYFTQTYPTSPQIDFQSTRGQVYHGVDVNGDRFSTRAPNQQTDAQQITDEEYRMKQYFRQQDAFRNRPSFPTTTSSPTVESIPYTPVSVDYDREVRIPSSTPNYFTTSSPRPVTQRQRVTFYHPAQTTPATTLYEDNANTVPPKDQVFEFSRDRDVETTPAGQTEKTSSNNNEISNQDTAEVEYEPNPYQLPSELPPLTPNLPGLVNGLIDKDRNNNADGQTTTQMESTTKPTPATRPTRRPINRIKKPVISKVSQSVSYSSSDYSTRRPINRVRRPYAGRNLTTSTSTERPSTSRSPIIRNPNRIRYNPTPEERQSLRIKTRKQGGGKKEDNSDDLEYQRDVLKQNYPVFKPSTKRTTTTPAPPSTDRPASESQQIFTVTPSSEQNFESLIEPMQIAQQYQEYPQNNYGPGYFPNVEEVIPTEAVLRNEISPVYSSTSTSEEPQPTTRRTPFIRRGPRIRTTTETPTTTTPQNEERFTIRTRAPPPRRVVKVRARTRRPHPASSTTTPNPDEDGELEPERNNYQRLNRFNQDLYQDEMAQRRQRIKSQFHLEPQESQWSPSLTAKSANNFQPLTQKEDQSVTKNFENEPEIVTANPEGDKSDSYVFNVSAGFGPTANTHFTSKVADEQETENTNKGEKSFADLLEEVMSDIGKESEKKSTDGAFFESQKTDPNLNRRGKWKNSSGNGETFETAESQNIGSQFFNSLYTGTMEKATESMLQLEDMYATTAAKEEPLTTTTPTTLSAVQLSTDSATILSTSETEVPTKPPADPQSTVSLDDMPLDTQPESITRRVDDLWNVEDLDSQPSVFSEVRKQLNELFTVEETPNETQDGSPDFVLPHKYEYTNIQRVRTTPESISTDVSNAVGPARPDNAKMFHKNLMESVVYATSTSTKEDASETEICYRGRCIRSEDLPPNHKLH